MIAEKKMLDLPIEQLVVLRQLREIDKGAESIAELAASIREIGLQQPLTVRLHDGKYIIIDGERRYWASRQLGIASVPVIVEEGELSESEVIRRQMIPNCQRQDLMPVEKARAIDRLMKSTNWPASQAAAKLGMSNASVTRLLSLLSLPAAILAKVESGDMSASTGYELSKVEDAAQQSELAVQASTGHLTRDALSGKLKASRKPASGSGDGKASRVTARLGMHRSVTVAACPLNMETLIEALEDLLAKARSARTKGLALTTFTKVLADQSHQ